MIRALVFDFDGLIADTESALIDAYADIHARHGVPFDRAAFTRSAGHADYAFDPWHAFEKWADRAELEIERQARNRERNLSLPALPGVVPLLDAARDAGLHLGVASNSRHAHVDGSLSRLGLRERFEFVACREDVASPKPEPDLYRLVIGRFGLKGNDAVALEDSQTGVTAAKRAGLWVVAVPGPSTAHQDFSAADLRLPSLSAASLPDFQSRFNRE